MTTSNPSDADLRIRIGLILFLSGFCSLVYQVAWFRLARLVFGASTSSTAAVVAIFMGGLGFGGYFFGRRLRRVADPLGLYVRLELGIALAAASSPAFFELARWVYVVLGGSIGLGPVAATAVRLVLATLVLGVATTLMGGTLPAVAQAVEREGDRGRRDVAWLYGCNTLGAVVGAFATTFVFIELLGIRRSIWVAALINVLIAIAARRLAAGRPATTPDAVEPEPVLTGSVTTASATTPPATIAGPRLGRLLLPAAAIVGFLFFLMEIVWYRMLAPVLGGSSYTFGLILTTALLGIGLGGLLYAKGPPSRRPTWFALSVTCVLEALFLALPFSTGDDLALFAAVTRQLDAIGFSGLVLSWVLVTGFVVFPASVVAGYQFPLLTALLGSERAEVGHDVGRVYAWNTWGAILGSLAGGFGLLPLLGAPRLWWLSAALLLALSLAAGLVGLARERRRGPLAWVFACAVLTIALCLAPGPSAFWRHTPIGAGRVEANLDGPNGYQRQRFQARHAVVTEADGVESSVALLAGEDLALYVNGKSDGAARADAPTVVMSGLIGAALHPDPRSALVIGLGTGMTAGWLTSVDSIESVDIVELEPAVIEFAREFAPVNEGVMDSPKVELLVGDGRELVLTGSKRYDVIFSEPSNPYRAGVADLFSSDFYRAVAQRLGSGGVFLQWLQGYEIDAKVVQTAVVTLGSVFPSVEIWQVHHSDLLLVASQTPIEHDLERLRGVVARDPFRRAMLHTWQVEGLEGFYSAFVGNPDLVSYLIKTSDRRTSTDDRPRIEFGFVRSLGRVGSLQLHELQRLARVLGADRPKTKGGELDWQKVDSLRHLRAVARSFVYDASGGGKIGPEEAARRAAREAYAKGRLEEAGRRWREQSEPPATLFDLFLVAETLADRADPAVEPHLRLLDATAPTEAAALRSLYAWRVSDRATAGAALLTAIERGQADGWFYVPIVDRALERGLELGAQDAELGRRIFEALGRPFAARLIEELRLQSRVRLAARLGGGGLCAAAFEAYEPHVIWDASFLEARSLCYDQAGHPLAAKAREDLGDYLAAAVPGLRELMAQGAAANENGSGQAPP